MWLLLLVLLITRITLQLREWNERRNSRESAKKFTARQNMTSKRSIIRSLRLKSSPDGSSLRKSISAFSNVSSSKKCGSKWRTTPIALHTVSPVSLSKVSRWATRTGSSRPCNRRNLMKRGRKGMNKYIWASTWRGKNSRSKRVYWGAK